MKIIIPILALIVMNGLSPAEAQSAGDPDKKLSGLFTRGSKGVLVAAHRGDWRNAPENSVQGLENGIAMGVDISEFDLKRTRDGRLVILHDHTLDRTTTGKGKPEDYTWEEIEKFNLRSGTGHPTRHRVPSFTEMLIAAKGEIIIDIDKGYEYYDDVIRELQEQDMMGQSILNIYGLPFDSLQSRHGKIPPDLTLQLIINPDNPGAEKIIDSYKAHPKTIVQIIFNSDSAWIIKKLPAFEKEYALWFNSLWPEQNGEHDDDRAVEENKPDETWGWLIGNHATILQTDRPKELLNYLRTKNLHK